MRPQVLGWIRQLVDAWRSKRMGEIMGLAAPPKVEEDINTYSNLLKRETGESVRTAIGAAILKGESPEARELFTFLSKVHKDCGGKDAETPEEVGVAYHFCLELVNRKPAAPVSQTFTSLNDAWLYIPADSEIAIGEAILGGESAAAHELRGFLTTLYQECEGRSAETAAEMGRIYDFCLKQVNRDPESPASRLFMSLNDPWLAEFVGLPEHLRKQVAIWALLSRISANQ